MVTNVAPASCSATSHSFDVEPVDVAAERDHRLVEYVGEARRHPAVTLSRAIGSIILVLSPPTAEWLT